MISGADSSKQVNWNRNLPLLVSLRSPIELWLPAHLDDVCIELDVAPDKVHRFLFSSATPRIFAFFNGSEVNSQSEARFPYGITKQALPKSLHL